jgi:hypothetical protein
MNSAKSNATGLNRESTTNAAGQKLEPGGREPSSGLQKELFEARLQRWSDAKSLPPLHVQKWLALDEPGRTRLLEIAEMLKMRAGQCVAALALLEEIAIREGQSIAEILERPVLRRILNSAGSGPGRARALLDELRTLRYPRLKHAAKRLAEQVTALKLPPSIKILLPRDLASDEVRVQIVAHGSAEMEEALACLTAKSCELLRLSAMVGGLDGALLEPNEAK